MAGKGNIVKRPNVLWYCTDQQRFDTIAASGNPQVRTPNIDRLAARGTLFTQAFCQSPVCTPSRASFLTGMYPSAVSVNQNGVPTFPEYYSDRLISRRLADEGYYCGLVGKLHLASAANGQEPRVDDGYEYFEYSHDHKGPDARGNDYAKWLRAIGEDPRELLEQPVARKDYAAGANNPSFGGLRIPTAEKDNIPAPVHQTRWCTEKALEFLDEGRRRKEPWFLSVNPFDPHPPFDPPWEYYRRYDAETMPGPHATTESIARQISLAESGVEFQSSALDRPPEYARSIQAAYYAMIELVDTEFGRILDWLDDSGEAENTIIIFMSDHGEMLGDHGLLLKGCRLYEGLVRVPLIVSVPGSRAPGTQNHELVELVDLVPTILTAVGMDVPYYVQGMSLLPQIEGDAATHRQSVRAEAFRVIDNRFQTHATMYRDHRWKLIRYHEIDRNELFDLENDPWEYVDLADDRDHQDTLRRLQAASFDATVAAHVPDVPRVAPY